MQAVLRAAAGDLVRGLSTALVVPAGTPSCPGCTCTPTLHCPPCTVHLAEVSSSSGGHSGPGLLYIVGCLLIFFCGYLLGTLYGRPTVVGSPVHWARGDQPFPRSRGIWLTDTPRDGGAPGR